MSTYSFPGQQSADCQFGLRYSWRFRAHVQRRGKDLLFALAVALSMASSSVAQGSRSEFSLETRTLAQFFPSALGRVSNIPISLRTIPGHPGDSNAGTLIAIPTDTIAPGLFSGFYAGVAPQLRVSAWRFRVGPQFGMYSRPQPQESSSGNTRELNQFGTQQRGTATALVYYAVVPRADLFSGGYGEVEHSVGAKAGLIAGYAWSPYSYTVKTGYDRYDSLEPHQIFKLATADMQRCYGGFRIGGRSALLLLVGVGKQSISIAPGASGVVIKAPTVTPFVSIGLSYEIGRVR